MKSNKKLMMIIKKKN